MNIFESHLIVWDWNGTLLNDHEVCTNNFNFCISKQGLPPVSSEEFRKLYRHPVIDMYHEIGFKFTEDYSFSDLSTDWYKGYQASLHEAKLFSQVLTLLSKIQRGIELIYRNVVELAKACGCKCILIASGHESRERLQKQGVLVIDSLGDLLWK